MESNECIVRYTADELDAMRQRGESQTDWARVDAMTEEALEASIDHEEEGEFDWSTTRIGIPGPKQQLTVRFDQDVLDWSIGGSKMSDAFSERGSRDTMTAVGGAVSGPPSQESRMMRRTKGSGRREARTTAVTFLAEELQRLATESAAKAEGESTAPLDGTSARLDLDQALDATWERSEAVYRSLADEQR